MTEQQTLEINQLLLNNDIKGLRKMFLKYTFKKGKDGKIISVRRQYSPITIRVGDKIEGGIVTEITEKAVFCGDKGESASSFFTIKKSDVKAYCFTTFDGGKIWEGDSYYIVLGNVEKKIAQDRREWFAIYPHECYYIDMDNAIKYAKSRKL